MEDPGHGDPGLARPDSPEQSNMLFLKENFYMLYNIPGLSYTTVRLIWRFINVSDVTDMQNMVYTHPNPAVCTGHSEVDKFSLHLHELCL